MAEPDPSAELKAENARLIALLEANGIQWRAQSVPVRPAQRSVVSGRKRLVIQHSHVLSPVLPNGKNYFQGRYS
jgi:hypothetical protein